MSPHSFTEILCFDEFWSQYSWIVEVLTNDYLLCYIFSPCNFTETLTPETLFSVFSYDKCLWFINFTQEKKKLWSLVSMIQLSRIVESEIHLQQTLVLLH